MAPIIDAHVHLFDHGFLPSAWHDATAWRWATRTFPSRDPEIVRGKIMDGLVDPGGELLRAEMDRVGIDSSVVIGLDWGWALGEQDVPIEDVHEAYRAIQAGDVGGLAGRFFGVVGIDPRRPNALEMTEKLIVDHRFRGYKLYPPCGYHPYDEACQPLLELCQELGVPVIVHSAPVGYPMRTRFAHPHGVNDVQAEHPELVLVLAHAGHGGWEAEAKDMAVRHPGTYLELSNWNHDIDIDADATAHAVLAMRDAVGAHRILFGSDHFGGRRFSGGTNLPRWIDFFRDLPQRAPRLGSSISTEEIDLILGLNAARVYDIPVTGA
ncbi:hypothetical protein PSU4_21030 [Pseudonocardia sulfidoxydans NBRC 16205]|uniref:Amidohydrolase-related domain-containing protein n=2 Tax=Pseudonocardia sulfidoxydans TaxID=54011 RepID=A0A511DEC0_9PSEU|nr:amidohydrolase family protein [Pseudonocardia sulfidoxydans]GEL23149.1 hypothetical protein PSU4_21030 [Pseudonocardia sulfidoxydans NBRC 16205]